MRPAPHLPQVPDGFRKRKLLARKAGHEPSAADLAARLQTAIDVEKVPPGRQPVGLALEKTPEDYPVTAQERARDVLDGVGIGLPP